MCIYVKSSLYCIYVVKNNYTESTIENKNKVLPVLHLSNKFTWPPNYY